MKAFEPGAIIPIEIEGVATAIYECRDEIARLTRQRDELLAALRYLQDMIYKVIERQT